MMASLSEGGADDDWNSRELESHRQDGSGYGCRTMALALERFGRLDILVNNAGRTFNKPLVETSVEEFDAILAVNARVTFSTRAKR